MEEIPDDETHPFSDDDTDIEDETHPFSDDTDVKEVKQQEIQEEPKEEIK